ncbi:hypothetical protein BTH42_07155 [Burkholderia sp. SRS-W-2-2016]|uniref:DUF4410 domain-containing protein n=1 Tax=Burkholderia sp. SRS-W-2-2016 TaxID=1926878 RepID=UPI00094B1EDE|nr:DUF4410 domain-containing protein [Burkholderia sp. SRS-W-2-2016]OLL32223.1 hypothetical protein BTH42_07155 [Burkholderia sp. SRS-W-2-2016]
MSTSVNSIKKNAIRFSCIALVCGSALFSGCASAAISNVSPAAAPAATAAATTTGAQPTLHPQVIYVAAFDADPQQVQLDNSGVLHKLKTQLSGSSAAQQQADDAAQVREQVADEIVHRLQSLGLNAVRLDAPLPADQNALIVQGSFDSIDAGNRRRRTLIGLGAGKSEVSSSVQIVYQPAGGAPRVVESFTANADSGKMPGVVETAGVGAAAGGIATAAAAGAGLHGVTETKRAGVSADAKRLGDAVAKQIAQFGAQAGFVAAAQKS